MRSACAVVAIGAGALIVAPVAAGEIDDLKAQIDSLMRKVQELEAKQARQQAEITAQRSQPRPAPANVVTGGDFPGSFKLPGSDTSVKIGGYVKLDMIYDLDQKGGAAQGIAAVDDGATNLDTGHFQAHARQTRVNIDTRTPSDWGQVRTFFEMDLFGSSGTETFTNAHNPRVRHAFGTLGPVLAGQTWSTFVDVSSYPETIDFEGPAGETFIRQAQLRYTQDLGGGTKLMAAIENPETGLANSAATSGRDRYPDVIGRVVHGADWGHISLAAVGRYLNAESGTADDNDFGWGLGLGGSVKTTGKDKFQFQVNGGDGIGRYMLETGKTGAAFFDTASNDLDLITAIGGFVAYQHWWADNLRSTAVYGIATNDNPGVAPGTTVETVQSGHLNLMWSPAKNVNIGIEYSLFDAERENGSDGRFSRIQFGAQYAF